MADSRVVIYRGGTIGPQPVRRADDKRKRLGVYSGIIDRGALGVVIKRNSREGRFLRTVEKLLLDHIGGKPTTTQKLLITRAARVALHLELVDEKAFGTREGLSTHALTHYIAWSNGLARMLKSLGLEAPVSANKPDLQTYLETLRAANGEAGTTPSLPSPRGDPKIRRPRA
jgi:hypothetical protein